MLSYRVSVNGSYVGLVHDCDRAYIRSLAKKYGAKALSLVPVILL